jgi:hypothetical protein
VTIDPPGPTRRGFWGHLMGDATGVPDESLPSMPAEVVVLGLADGYQRPPPSHVMG